MYYDLWPYVLWPLDFQIQKLIFSAKTIWGNTVTYLPMDHQSASENDQSFIFYNRGSRTSIYEKICLRVQKPNTMNHWLLSIALVDCFSLQSCSGILEFKVRPRSYQSYLWLRPCIALSPYLEQRCWEALSRLEPIIHSMYAGTLLCCKVTRNMIGRVIFSQTATVLEDLL